MNPLHFLHNIKNPYRFFFNLTFFLLLSFKAYTEENALVREVSDLSEPLETKPLDTTSNTKEVQEISIEPIASPTNFFKKSSGSFYEDFKLQQEQTLQKTRIAADQNQENVSHRLHQFSSYVDNFFADDNYIQESTDSRMRISIANQFQQYETPTFQPRMSLLLALPNTQNRWRIRFQSDDNDEDNSNSDTNLIDSVNKTTYSTAVSGILRESKLVDIRADAGIKFRTPIDPFTKLRIRRSFLLEKTELRLSEIFQWRDSQGKTATSALEVEYPFTLKYFFRSRSEAVYWDIDSYWSGSQSFTFYHQRSAKSVIAYAIGLDAQDEDELHTRKKDQVNDYWVEVRYRKNFYQDWLFYQISPGLIRPREFEFQTLPRLELKLEVLYGGTPAKNTKIDSANP